MALLNMLMMKSFPQHDAGRTPAHAGVHTGPRQRNMLRVDILEPAGA